jgi:hypothetical protein
MAEYIDKTATVGILEAMSRSTDCECIKKRLEKAAKRVSAIPAADVAPVVHARWIDDGRGIIICPECKRGYNLHAKYTHYCPNCGAKMDGGDGDAAD